MSPSTSTTPNDISATCATMRQIRLKHELPDLAPKVERGYDYRKLDSKTAVHEAPAKQAKLVEPGWGLGSTTPSDASGRRSVVAMLDTVAPETKSESEPTTLTGKPPLYTLQDIGNSVELDQETIVNGHRDCGAKENIATRTADGSSISTRVDKSTLPYKKLFPEAYADLRAEAREHEKDPPTPAQKFQPSKRRDAHDNHRQRGTDSWHDSFDALRSEPRASTIGDINEKQRCEPDIKHKDIHVSIDRLDIWFNTNDEAEKVKKSGQPDNDNDF